MFFSFSASFPFINGVGCDFSFYYEDEDILNHGVCRAGVLDVVINSKTSSSIVRERILWGVFGGAFYGYVIERETVRPAEHVDSRTALFEKTSFLAGRYALIDNKSLATYIKYPVEMVRLNYINGKLAFFSSSILEMGTLKVDGAREER
ncbi:hypothetical protein [Aeromonas jandaei]|uniref:hypothetical protein n=1 Tax=Aeromonas jandaei TaxID=650 RepID=UPI003B9EA3DC